MESIEKEELTLEKFARSMQVYEKAKSRLATNTFDNKDSAKVEMLSKSSPEKEKRDLLEIKFPAGQDP